jgi:cytochrome c peroxidase/6-phosphogluconolactonase (cycloisomerase 2 family)
MRSTLVALTALVLAVLALLPAARTAPPKEPPHRSPVELALLPGGRALTANHTSDSVSLIDLDRGKVLAEAPCGRKPVAVACTRDGRRAAVSNFWSGTVSLFEVGRDSLKPAGTVGVGLFPRGLAFAPDGRLFAAVAARDEVVEVSPQGKVTHRWPAPREPRALTLSTDGAWLAAASSRSAQVRLWDTKTHKLAWERKIEDAFNLRGLAFSPDGQFVVCAHHIRRDFPVALGTIDKGWVIDSRLTRFPLKADTEPPAEQVALDKWQQAVGDPEGVAFTPDGRRLTVTAAGTHELLLFDATALPWTGGDPGDFLSHDLENDDSKFNRVRLSGRPMSLAYRADGDAVTANYLLDAVQVIDLKRGKVRRTVALGGPVKSSLVRQGEALFYDAKRSHNQWFSCHSCHVDGHTCHMNFDTLNDDSYGNPKLTPSLRGVARTGPWTWHGWQKDLGAAVRKSYTETMFGPDDPTDREVEAVVAFLGTLDYPPNPNLVDGKMSDASKRGQAIFEGKAKCARCHEPPEYTSELNHDVKLEADGSPFKRWSPPTLRGVWDRGPFLHDGRAKTLDELLQGPHSSEKLGGARLSADERRDLIAFLNSL